MNPLTPGPEKDRVVALKEILDQKPLDALFKTNSQQICQIVGGVFLLGGG